MADVEVYRYVKGEKIERAMATLPGVQAELDRAAEAIRGGAEGVLAAHRYSGASQILPVESGSVDRFVVLSDERGLHAAWAIEKGAKGGRGGVHALATAAAAAALAAAGG